MAHNIGQYDKQQGIEVAWHGLTEVVPAISLKDNWLRTWDLQPRKTKDSDSNEELPWAYLRCTDNPAIKIGKPYNPESFFPVNNAAFLDMIVASIAGTTHEVVSVGSVRNRGRVFVTIRLNNMEHFEAAGRKFSAYLNFGNGHDKSSVLWVNTSNICTVCDNTFTFNLFRVENESSDTSDDVRVRQRHTKNVTLRLPEISKLIDMAVGVQGEFKAAMETLGDTYLAPISATNLFAGFLGRNISVKDRSKGLSTRSFNRVNRLTELFATGKGNTGRTLADAFSAVTDYFSHESSGGSENPHRQFLSSEYGSGNDRKGDFYRIVQNPESRMATEEIGEELLANTKS